MIRKIFIIVLFIFSLLTSYSQTGIKVMSYNIRYDAPNDGNNIWDIRKNKLGSLMAYYGADFIGTQEVQHHQLEYLLSNLPAYSFAGVARTDGKQAGEYSALLFNKEKFTLVQQGTFWLSPTPSVPSKGWDAAFERIVTYGLFKLKGSRKHVWILNTHFDHVGKEARFNAARMVVDKINELQKVKKVPVVFMGDLNARKEENTIEYLNQHLQDARLVSELPAYGPEDTWNAFDFSKKPAGRIDYIYIDKNPKIKVKKFATIDDFYDFKYPSDHLPVLAHIEIK